MTASASTAIKRVLLSWSGGKDSAWTLYQRKFPLWKSVTAQLARQVIDGGEVVVRDGFVYADLLLEETL